MTQRDPQGLPIPPNELNAFEEWWQERAWGPEQSEVDQASYACQFALLRERRYRSVLELGCGAGFFTRQLAEIADHVVAIDIAPSAIKRASAWGLDPRAVDLRVANIMDYDPRAEGPWDLVVMSETIYLLGWLYPVYKVGCIASELFAATTAGGRLLMANAYGAEREHLHRPYLIDTYRDLFLNVGYRREAEEIVRGTKDDTEYEVLVTLFAKRARGPGRDDRARTMGKGPPRRG